MPTMTYRPKEQSKMKVLVTGCEGAIGRPLLARLLEDGHEVRGFDSAQRSHADIEYITGDLREEAAVAAAVHGVDAVAHLGAIPADRKGKDGDVLSINVQGTWNILLGCLKADVERAVCFSSINALGCVLGHHPAQRLPIDDDYPRHPMSAYQLSKHLAEETCLSFSQRYHMITPCMRPVWVSNPEVSALWDTWRQEGIMDEKMRHQYWVYVDSRDMVDATCRALSVPLVGHEAFLIAADDSITATPTAELIDRYFPDTTWHVDQGRYLADDPHKSLVNCSKAKKLLGWRPRHSWRHPNIGLNRGP
jgi:nucleoside-diphosphate-sugar epimerase